MLAAPRFWVSFNAIPGPALSPSYNCCLDSAFSVICLGWFFKLGLLYCGYFLSWVCMYLFDLVLLLILLLGYHECLLVR